MWATCRLIQFGGDDSGADGGTWVVPVGAREVESVSRWMTMISIVVWLPCRERRRVTMWCWQGKGMVVCKESSWVVDMGTCEQWAVLSSLAPGSGHKKGGGEGLGYSRGNWCTGHWDVSWPLAPGCALKRERGNGYARGRCGWLMWARMGIETFSHCLHLVVGLKRKRGGGMWYSQHHYGWYIGAGGHWDPSSIWLPCCSERCGTWFWFWCWETREGMGCRLLLRAWVVGCCCGCLWHGTGCWSGRQH